MKIFINEQHLREVIAEVLESKIDEGGFDTWGLDGPNTGRSSGPGGTDDFASVSGLEMGQIDYTPSGTAKKVNSGVKFNAKLRNAWEWLSPFLPDGSVMTSGGRTQADQNRIIRNYAKRHGYTGNENDYDAMHAFTKSKGLVIARRIGSGHGSFEAMDISGAPLNQIEAAVNAVSANTNIPVTFSEFKRGVRNRSIVEPKNNAVHVGIVKADVPVDSQKVAQLITSFGKETSLTEGGFDTWKIDPSATNYRKDTGMDVGEPGALGDLSLMPDDSKDIGAVHPSFRPIVQKIMSKLSAEGFQPIIGSGYRSAKSQQDKIDKGYSKSPHLIGRHASLDTEGNRAAYAVDLVDKRHSWSSTTGAYDFFKRLGEIVESEFSNDITWGGSWDRKDRTIEGQTYNIGWDPAHIQWKGISRDQVERNTLAGIAKIKSNSATV